MARIVGNLLRFFFLPITNKQTNKPNNSDVVFPALTWAWNIVWTCRRLAEHFSGIKLINVRTDEIFG